MNGPANSAAEVTHISSHGFWVLIGDEEFKWFKQATVKQIAHVEYPSPDHLYWPSLDVDLSVNAIRRP